jgi:hypothetical protein
MQVTIDSALTALQVEAVRADLFDLMKPSTTIEKGADWAYSKWYSDPTLTVGQRKALKYWVVGGWGYLQDYLLGLNLGALALVAPHAQTIKGEVFPAATFAQRVNDLDGALAALGTYAYPAFRRARYLSTAVYSTLIVPGDYISSPSYWASSTIKGAEAAGGGDKWGREKLVYTKIYGLGGKYLGGYSDIDGEREVLFPRGSIFKVEAILRDNDIFFTVVREVAALPLATVSKDPFTGL